MIGLGQTFLRNRYSLSLLSPAWNFNLLLLSNRTHTYSHVSILVIMYVLVHTIVCNMNITIMQKNNAYVAQCVCSVLTLLTSKTPLIIYDKLL